MELGFGAEVSKGPALVDAHAVSLLPIYCGSLRRCRTFGQPAL